MLGIDPGVLQVADEFFFKPAGGQEHAAKAEDTAQARVTVLVVDDQHLVADTTAEILNRQGFRALAAYNGEDALRILEDLKPDYLLADVMMPAMNGVELAIAVTKTFPTTHIVLFSGQAGVTDLLRQAKAQGYEFEVLAKPIHPEKLVEYLKKK